MIPAAAPGYAVPANVAAAPRATQRATQHLPLRPWLPPAPLGASLWFPKKDLQQNE